MDAITSVVSSESIRAAPPTNVTVRYAEHRVRRELKVATSPATRFDRIVISRTEQTLAPMASFGSWRRRVYQMSRRMLSALSRPKRLPPLLDMRDKEPNNIAHLLLDILPYLLYARKQLGQELMLLTRPIRPHLRPLLDMFGVRAICEYGNVHASVIRVRGTRGLAIYDLPSAFDTWGIQFERQIYADFERLPGTWPEKIFLARRDSRRLLNHAQVDALTTVHGYQTIYMEDYSIPEQLSIGASAKHVIAIHGAAMAFLIMAKNIDSVIELMPPNVYHEYFPVCLAGKVARYYQIIPEFDFSAVQSWDSIARFKDAAFAADADEVGKALASIDSIQTSHMDTDDASALLEAIA